MKAVLFDLDNTLYPEIDFVKSGFRAVARHLSSRSDLGEEAIFNQLLEILQRYGRGKVFDLLLRELGLFTVENVKLLVYLYRSHRPELRLYDDTLTMLGSLRDLGVRLGMVTDGMASVQRRKISALGLEDLFEVIVCSDELGADCWKPSRMPFKVALELLRVSPRESAYVGDDVRKDFIGPNSMGMLTIRMTRGGLRNLRVDVLSEPAEAQLVVSTLGEIIPIIRGQRDDC